MNKFIIKNIFLVFAILTFNAFSQNINNDKQKVFYVGDCFSTGLMGEQFFNNLKVNNIEVRLEAFCGMNLSDLYQENIGNNCGAFKQYFKEDGSTENFKTITKNGSERSGILDKLTEFHFTSNDILVIQLGSNDYEMAQYQQSAFEVTFKKIIFQIQLKYPEAYIYFQLPPPAREETYHINQMSEKIIKTVKNIAARDFASGKNQKVFTLPNYLKSQFAEGWDFEYSEELSKYGMHYESIQGSKGKEKLIYMANVASDEVLENISNNRPFLKIKNDTQAQITECSIQNLTSKSILFYPENFFHAETKMQIILNNSKFDYLLKLQYVSFILTSEQFKNEDELYKYKILFHQYLRKVIEELEIIKVSNLIEDDQDLAESNINELKKLIESNAENVYWMSNVEGAIRQIFSFHNALNDKIFTYYLNNEKTEEDLYILQSFLGIYSSGNVPCTDYLKSNFVEIKKIIDIALEEY